VAGPAPTVQGQGWPTSKATADNEGSAAVPELKALAEAATMVPSFNLTPRPCSTAQRGIGKTHLADRGDSSKGWAGGGLPRFASNPGGASFARAARGGVSVRQVEGDRELGKIPRRPGKTGRWRACSQPRRPLPCRGYLPPLRGRNAMAPRRME